ncbi:hypothetical protein GCM10023310_71700 [Paenibacillus vulneris]|uniref:Uncharacterized protein n=1 Tax=Paenibacillus vulneris TaxID=1133364 RepID=A0ABW3UZ42_9BACL|nr:hypothetical protein [Paenibacillus sp. 32352]
MKPALEKFLLIAATLAAIGIFIFVALWGSIKEKKTQMDDLFNNTNVPTSYHYQIKGMPQTDSVRVENPLAVSSEFLTV